MELTLWLELQIRIGYFLVHISVVLILVQLFSFFSSEKQSWDLDSQQRYLDFRKCCGC